MSRIWRWILLCLVAVFVAAFFLGLAIAGDYRTIITYTREDGATAWVQVSPGADHLVLQTHEKIICSDRVIGDTEIYTGNALWFKWNKI